MLNVCKCHSSNSNAIRVFLESLTCNRAHVSLKLKLKRFSEKEKGNSSMCSHLEELQKDRKWDNILIIPSIYIKA